VHEEGLEPTHLAVPEPKGHMNEHDAAGSANRAGRDAGDDANVHEGPRGEGGWAAGQGWTGGVPVRDRHDGRGGVARSVSVICAIRMLNGAVLRALASDDVDAALGAARALSRLLDDDPTLARLDVSAGDC
jgi:hypothetical protein